jgi:hypothetical protein
MVRIDFGSGHVVTRTFQGNIATYVCDSSGQVLDVLPGIYTPNVYQDRLEQLRLLAYFLKQEKADNRDAVLRDYHRRQATALASNAAPEVLINTGDRSKRVIERPIKLLAPDDAKAYRMPESERAVADGIDSRIAAKIDGVLWNALVEDTRSNESVRRRQIHEMLADSIAANPTAIVKRLYKDVLHANLDDPFLGLGDDLFGHYPFAGEESKTSK